jgi:tripartite-type tricarboxylate transporter receptor subunit TctC
MVASAPGGSPDFQARVIAPALSASLSQQVIIDNRSSGVIPGEIVSKAPSDGYTLLFASNLLWIGTLMQKTPYDAVRDFMPISLTTKQPNVVIVHPSLPVQSIKQLVALAKAKPGALNYASTGTGSPNHLGPELFKAMAGVNIVRVNYKAAATALSALLGGEVQVMFTTTTLVVPHIKSGRLRALAVTSTEPSALLPGLPTVAAAGLAGYQSESMYGLLAPPKTARAIIARLNQEIVQVLTRAEVKEKFHNAGVEVVGSSPDEFATLIKSDLSRLGKVIQDAGIREE